MNTIAGREKMYKILKKMNPCWKYDNSDSLFFEDVFYDIVINQERYVYLTVKTAINKNWRPEIINSHNVVVKKYRRRLPEGFYKEDSAYKFARDINKFCERFGGKKAEEQINNYNLNARVQLMAAKLDEILPEESVTYGLFVSGSNRKLKLSVLDNQLYFDFPIIEDNKKPEREPIRLISRVFCKREGVENIKALSNTVTALEAFKGYSLDTCQVYYRSESINEYDNVINNGGNSTIDYSMELYIDPDKEFSEIWGELKTLPVIKKAYKNFMLHRMSPNKK